MEQSFLITKYNHWANDRMCLILNQLNDAHWHQELVSSFPSIYKTAYHIYGAETIWLQRLNGYSAVSFPEENLKGRELCKTWLAASKALVDFIGLGNIPDRIIDFADMQGKEYAMEVTGIIAHVCNHSTFHRGQLVTMFRKVGYSNIQSTDLITYLRLPESDSASISAD